MRGIASIIIGFTPFHQMPMLQVVRLAEGDIHLFHPMLGQDFIEKIGDGPTYLGGCDAPHAMRLGKYIRAGQQIDRVMRQYEDVALYVPHPFNPLANYAFFHSRECRRYIYQDGILNYYDARNPLASTKWRVRQVAKAAAVGLPYKFYTGHLSGIDDAAVSGGYFTHPEKVVRASRFPLLERIHFESSEGVATATARKCTLFLDQPIEEVVGRDVATELRRRTVEYTGELGGPVLYKPHYAQKERVSLGRGWEILDAELCKLPAEEVVSRLGVCHVVSFFTSALANIAMCHPDITCHATAADVVPITIDGRVSTLAEMFSGFGVNVVSFSAS